MLHQFVMKKIIVSLLFAIFLSISFYNEATAQCALCKANAETSLKEGSNAAKGLNIGIMYLLIIPYAMVGAVGYWWYVKNKKQNAEQ